MNNYIKLIRVLKDALQWNLARVTCFAYILLGILQTRTVNLAEIADSFPGDAKTSSNYKRIQRFFREFHVDCALIAKLIVRLLNINKFILLLDRTNWKLGKIDINFLVLSFVHRGVAFPLMWVCLDGKRGNSNTEERIELINRFLQHFNKDQIEYLFADREFIGEEWFLYLKKEIGIRFRIRIRNNLRVSGSSGITKPADNLFKEFGVNVSVTLDGARKVCGVDLFVTGMLLSSGEYLIVVSPDCLSSREILGDYKKDGKLKQCFNVLNQEAFV